MRYVLVLLVDAKLEVGAAQLRTMESGELEPATNLSTEPVDTSVLRTNSMCIYARSLHEPTLILHNYVDLRTVKPG